MDDDWLGNVSGFCGGIYVILRHCLPGVDNLTCIKATDLQTGTRARGTVNRRDVRIQEVSVFVPEDKSPTPIEWKFGLRKLMFLMS